MKKVAEKLRLLRQEKNFSQQYVADCMNVSISTISRMENSPEKINLEFFARIAKLYQIELGKIFSDTENLTSQVSKITTQVSIPFCLDSAQLFCIAKELRKIEQERLNHASNNIRK